MSTHEPARLHLYEQARNAWGEAAADTLMTALLRDPDRFATKDDLAVLESNLSGELRSEIGTLRAEVVSGQADLLRTLFFGMVGTNATLVGFVLAAVSLA